jgi:hypothetical protein
LSALDENALPLPDPPVELVPERDGVEGVDIARAKAEHRRYTENGGDGKGKER